MHVLIAVVAAAAAAASAVARPPGTRIHHSQVQEPVVDPVQVRARPPLPSSFGEYMLPRYILPHFLGLQEDARLPPPLPPALPMMHYDWLSREIGRLSALDFEENSVNFDADPPDRRVDLAADNVYEPPPVTFQPILTEKPRDLPIKPLGQPKELYVKHPNYTMKNYTNYKSKEFALTPKDDGYFEIIKEIPAYSKDRKETPVLATLIEKAEMEPADMVFEEPRKTRQNPTLSKTKNLIAENLDKLRNGVHDENDIGTVDASHINLLESATDPTDSIYGVALIAAVGAALTVVVIGFGYGWYTVSKRAKAAADVDYPAYGVTGPSIDTSADGKLAHSAHMYHYQHQKQQILAMERNGMENRNGSVSDIDSEEENEEGDYTVYECPGFATTGDMEVKNPMFSEEPTPATPAKGDVNKTQPNK